MIKKYYLIDPIGSRNSGITTYSSIICNLISTIVPCKILSREANETYEQFGKRISILIRECRGQKIAFEIPETRSYLFEFSEIDLIHIRLHALDAICNTIQGVPFSKNRLLSELKQIQKCRVVSSPSYLLLEKTDIYISIDDCVVYPNLMPLPMKTAEKKCYDYLFLGRADYLKGFDLLNEIAKKNE